MRPIHILCLFITILSYTEIINAQIPKTNDQIEAILSKLTLEEKAGQLNLIPIEGEPTDAHLQMIREGKVGCVIKSNGVVRNHHLQEIAVKESNSGIPILFQEDVIHGYKTIAPVPFAEAASWDMEAIQNSAAIAAREAAASGIHLTYAPMVDISRDPRWGRMNEGGGEDPYLGSCIAKARVKGFQESGQEVYQNILSCVKHFAGYGASLAGRDYNIQEFSERELREVHLPPFQAAIDAGVSSVMASYTAYNGLPASASSYLLKDLLRDEMGFEGLVMTDWQNINNLINFGVAENDTIAVKMAIEAGNDLDMSAEKFVWLLPYLVRSGQVSEELVDNAVRQVLILKQKAGLLDDPYGYFNEKREKSELLSDANKAGVKDITLKSMVLLKNEAKALPIKEATKKIAVIGPFAKATRDLMGWWNCMGHPDDVISIYDGLQTEFGDKVELSYAQGCSIDSFKMAGAELIPEAVETAQKADLVIMVLGEEFWMDGEGGGTASLKLPSLQEELLAKVSETGKTIVTVIVASRPYILTNIAEHSDAILYAWHPGTMGGEAVAEILSGKFNPSGKLPVTFPYHEGQVPIYYCYKQTSHSMNAGPHDSRYTNTYRDIKNTPLYPFGYGLSYTHYEYSNLKLSSNTMSKNGSITVSIDVSNTGDIAGSEIVQLYIRDKVCSVVRPVKELKDFTILELQPGETKTAIFELTPDKLAFIGRNYQTTLEPGEFTLFVGASSDELIESTFLVK